MARFFDQNFQVARIIDRTEDWLDYRLECNATHMTGMKRIRTASQLNHVDWNMYNLHDYIFTHNTIVASVCSDKDGHTITEGSVPTINANQNAWLNEVLGPPTNVYQTFRGAENFYEHVQDFNLSKGKILDSVLRKVKNQAGEEVWYCFRGDAKVLMADGSRKEISDIEPGEYVVSGKGVTREVLANSISYSKDLVELKIRGVIDSFVCTKDHKILSKSDLNDEWEWKEANSLCRNDWVLQPKISLDKNDKIDVDPDFAWFMGFYAAEGSLVERKKSDGTKYFSHTQLTINIKEKEIVENIAHRILDSIGPYEIPFFKSRWSEENMSKKVYGAIDSYEKNNGCNIRIGHRKLAEECNRLCGRGSKTKNISEVIFNWNDESLKYFLAGLFDGDGHTRKNVIALTSTGNDLIKGVELILASLGMAYSTTGNWHDKPYSKAMVLELDCYSSQELKKYLKLKNKFESIPEKIHMGNRASLSTEDGIIRRIESIVKQNDNIEIPVYNIEVEEDHSYLVSNIVVKNCDILTATNRRHRDLVARIINKEIQTLSMGCGLAGTKINLGNNIFKNIEDIQVGDAVLTHKGRLRNVTSLFQSDIKAVPLYSVDYISAQNPLRLTGEHPIFIATKESVECSYTWQKRPCKLDKEQSQCFYSKKLPFKCAGQRVPCGRNKETYKYDMKFVPIGELQVGDYVAKTIRDEEIDNVDFSNDICRLFGLYIGDGYIGWKWNNETKSKISPIYVEFCFSNKEIKLHEEVIQIAKKIVNEDKIKIREVPERSGTYIKIYDEKLAKLFLDHAGEGAWSKCLSEIVMTLPKAKQELIISGMMDSDGCFYEKTNQLSYTTASESLFNQLHMLLLRLRIENLPSIVQRRPSGFKKGNELYDQYMIQIASGSSWKVKCNKNKNYGNENKLSNQLCIFYENYYLCKIKSISEISINSTVYNFSVEEDESYCVDNLAVHNCLANLTQCSKCGKIIKSDWDACNHIKYELGQDYLTPYGYLSRITELCGIVGIPDSCRFIEASWVEAPAFKGAVVNHYISIPGTRNISAKRIINLQDASEAIMKISMNDVDTLKRVRVADKHSMVALKLYVSELSKAQRNSRIRSIGQTLEKL